MYNQNISPPNPIISIKSFKLTLYHSDKSPPTTSIFNYYSGIINEYFILSAPDSTLPEIIEFPTLQQECNIHLAQNILNYKAIHFYRLALDPNLHVIIPLSPKEFSIISTLDSLSSPDFCNKSDCTNCFGRTYKITDIAKLAHNELPQDISHYNTQLYPMIRHCARDSNNFNITDIISEFYSDNNDNVCYTSILLPLEDNIIQLKVDKDDCAKNNLDNNYVKYNNAKYHILYKHDSDIPYVYIKVSDYHFIIPEPDDDEILIKWAMIPGVDNVSRLHNYTGPGINIKLWENVSRRIYHMLGSKCNIYRRGIIDEKLFVMPRHRIISWEELRWKWSSGERDVKVLFRFQSIHDKRFIYSMIDDVEYFHRDYGLRGDTGRRLRSAEKVIKRVCDCGECEKCKILMLNLVDKDLCVVDRKFEEVECEDEDNEGNEENEGDGKDENQGQDEAKRKTKYIQIPSIVEWNVDLLLMR